MQLPEIPVGVETEQNELYTDTPNSLVFKNVTIEDDRELGITATSDQATDNGFVNRISRINPANFLRSSLSQFAISASGRYVALRDSNNSYVYVYDRQTDSITSSFLARDTNSRGSLSNLSISDSGRYVAFLTTNSRLGGSRNATAIRVYDRDNNTTITVFSAGDLILPSTIPTLGSPLISANGQYVVFVSNASTSGAINSNNNNVPDIFVYDLQTKTTSRVSLGLEGSQTNGGSSTPSISPSGRYIAYQSDASNLVVDDTNNISDIFVYDRHTGMTQRISVSSDGIEANNSSSAPSISEDGRYVVFSSNASNLVADDTNNTGDIFVHDRHTGMTQRISVSSDGIEANNSSSAPSISEDGRYVVFSSNASNLVADDTNNTGDIFVHDRHTGVTSRVSVSLEGTQANGSSSSPSILANGNYIAFLSSASNLVPNDTIFSDIFIYDFLPNVINGTESQDILIGIGTFGYDRITGFGGADILSGGVGGDEFIYTDIKDGWDTITDFQPGSDRIVLSQLFNSLNLSHLDYSTASTQGYLRFETFGNDTTILIDPDGKAGSTPATPLVTVSGVPAAKIITSLIFPVATEVTNSGISSRTSRVSVNSDGIQGNGSSSNPSISTDGRYVVFESSASNLVASDTNTYSDIFVYDRVAGIINRVSISSDGIQGSRASSNASLSASGRYVVFQSSASNLVASDTNNYSDIFVHDRDTGITSRVSISSDGIQGSSDSSNPSLSSDGRYVVFESAASNLVADDTNSATDIFVHDRDTGITSRVSVSSDGIQGGSSISGSGGSSNPSISADGRYVVFQSDARNLVAGDTNNATDIFVHDRDTGITSRVSVTSEGIQANNNSSNPSLSADGRYVVFQSFARNLVAGDTNNASDIFVHDRDTGITSRVSVTSEGIQASGSNPSISTDGRYVVFESFGSNLVVGDTNSANDIFVHDRLTSTTRRVSIGTEGIQANNNSSNPSISANGNYVTFVSFARSLVLGDANSYADFFYSDIFVYDFLPNVINGTQSQDTLIGTFGYNQITAFGGADILTGGAGITEFIYTDIQDTGDTITNFKLGSDKIVLTQLFNSLNLSQLDFGTASTQGYLGFASRDNNTTILIDSDGDADTASPIPLVTVSGISVRTLNNPSNFLI